MLLACRKFCLRNIVGLSDGHYNIMGYGLLFSRLS